MSRKVKEIEMAMHKVRWGHPICIETALEDDRVTAKRCSTQILSRILSGVPTDSAIQRAPCTIRRLYPTTHCHFT